MLLRIAKLVTVFALLAGALAFGTAASAAASGNSANAKLCQKGGYANYVRTDGTTFATEEQCVSYAAKGGTLMPFPDLKLNTTCSTDAIGHTLICIFTVTNIGAGPANGTSILLQSGMWTTGQGYMALASFSVTCPDAYDPTNQPTTAVPPDAHTSATANVLCATPLGAGQQLAATVIVGIGTVAAGTPIDVTAAVDPNNRIAESNESNNTYTAVVPAP